MVAVTVTIEGSEHDTEGSSPLTEKDEEMVSQRLLREEKAPVVDCREVRVSVTKERHTKSQKRRQTSIYSFSFTGCAYRTLFNSRLLHIMSLKCIMNGI